MQYYLSVEQIPETVEEVREYVRQQFRRALDGYINRPLTPINVESIKASVEQTVRKLVGYDLEVRVIPNPDDPMSLDVTIYAPPLVYVTFDVETDLGQP